MNTKPSTPVDSLERALDTLGSESPFLEPVIRAFREVIACRDELKKTISDCPESGDRMTDATPLSKKAIAALVDPWNDAVRCALEHLQKAFPGIAREIERTIEAFSQGRPQLSDCIGALVDERPESGDRITDATPLSKKTITALVDPWNDAVRCALEHLQKAFPGIAREIERTIEAFAQGRPQLSDCVSALVDERPEEIAATAADMNVDPAVLRFLLGQILKPFVEKRTEGLRLLIKDLPWHQGCCPVCGEMPELSFLQADEGQRWLRCSLCGHDWRFDRMSCPGCAAKDARREIISIETSPHEWVELCPECRRYLVATDLRNSSAHIPEVAALGMLHLAALARERGYAPLAECAWGLDLPLDSRQPSGHEN